MDRHACRQAGRQAGRQEGRQGVPSSSATASDSTPIAAHIVLFSVADVMVVYSMTDKVSPFLVRACLRECQRKITDFGSRRSLTLEGAF